MRWTLVTLACLAAAPGSMQQWFAGVLDSDEPEPAAAFDAEEALDEADLDQIEGVVEDMTAQFAAQIKHHVTAQVTAHKKGSRLAQSRIVKQVSELHLAVANNQFEVAEKLLAAGADPDEPSPMQLTPLHSASEYGYKDIVDLLIVHNATIDARGPHDVTPLHLAAHKGRVSTVELLLREGAPIDALMEPSLGYSSLFMAADMGHSRVVTLLLAANASTELRDYSGRTALHAAAAAGHEGVVQALLEAGAFADARDNDGLRPMLMATASRHADVVALLEEHGVELVTVEEEESLKGRSTLRVEIKPFMRMPS